MSEAKVSTGARTDEGIASRLAAVEILYRVDQESAYADVLLGQRLPDFAPADRRAIMRLGLFQLRFLDRIPQHAVVDTAVSLAKRISEARKASGFVNAVMRRAT